MKVDGRRLLVNGEPFVVKGVNYSPTPVSKRPGPPSSYNWWNDQKSYKTDFPLIASMGANVIRTFYVGKTTAPGVAYEVPAATMTKAALDFAFQNNLYVIMGFPVDTSLNLADGTTRQYIYDNFLSLVSSWTSHPAVLAWSLGNEQNLSNGNDQAWYTLVDSCAFAAHSLEGPNFHPVMTVEGNTGGTIIGNIGDASKKADDASMPNLDIWGANLYLGPTFSGAFSTHQTKTSKPLLIAEFGWDAYDESVGAENQTIQATNISSQWNDITSNLSALDSAKVCVGGVVFEWTDEWWKSFANALLDSGHDVSNDFPNAGVFIQEEWWGIASIESGSERRFLRQAYTTLRDLWAPSPIQSAGLFISDVRNFPNPLRLGATTTIRFSLREQANLTTEVLDVLGRKIVTLKNVTLMTNNTYSYTWDGKDSHGNEVTAGLYICRVEASNSDRREVKTRRIMVVR